MDAYEDHQLPAFFMVKKLVRELIDEAITCPGAVFFFFFRPVPLKA